MSMKIVIYIDSETGEIFYYIPDSDTGEAVFIQPRIKKKEWESEEDEKTTH